MKVPKEQHNKIIKPIKTMKKSEDIRKSNGIGEYDPSTLYACMAILQ
jgi:hypothetical protein